MRSSGPPDDIQDIARALCTGPVKAVSELRKGGNSRIFRVDTPTARYALKKYPASDNRNRLEAEVSALRFLERKGIERTPRVVSVSPELRFALLSWLEGDAIETVTDSDVAEFAAFQVALDASIDGEDRTDIVRRLIESVGGRLESLYFSFGEYDTVCIYEVPDNTAAAALAIAVGASGALATSKTTLLLTAAEGREAMARSGSAAYTPPG